MLCGCSVSRQWCELQEGTPRVQAYLRLIILGYFHKAIFLNPAQLCLATPTVVSAASQKLLQQLLLLHRLQHHPLPQLNTHHSQPLAAQHPLQHIT
jgi:hypothetical protein